MSYIVSPKDENEQKRMQYQNEIAEWERKIEKCKEQINAIKNENEHVSAAGRRREEIDRKIEKSKSVGKKLIIIGAIVAVAGASAIIPIPIGLAMVIIGIIMRKPEKKYESELKEIGEILSAVDGKIAEVEKTMDPYYESIYRLRGQIEAIDMQELEEKIGTGHIGLYATQEKHFVDTKPREPEAKKYASHFLIDAQLYINGMLYGRVERDNDRSFKIFEIDEPGTLRLEVVANYEIPPERFDWQSAPTPVRLEKGSKYIWVHISTCQKGTHVYSYVYDNVKDFMDATGISKYEIMKKVPR